MKPPISWNFMFYCICSIGNVIQSLEAPGQSTAGLHIPKIRIDSQQSSQQPEHFPFLLNFSIKCTCIALWLYYLQDCSVRKLWTWTCSHLKTLSWYPNGLILQKNQYKYPLKIIIFYPFLMDGWQDGIKFLTSWEIGSSIQYFARNSAKQMRHIYGFVHGSWHLGI